MLPKRYRLRLRGDVQRVRMQGRSWRHPLAILLALPAAQEMSQLDAAADQHQPAVSRFAFVASRRVGHAVSRNRAKRLLRAAVQANMNQILPGWDCVFIAREGTPHASYQKVNSAVLRLLERAHLLANDPGSDGDSSV